jgi:hypothetical protein
MNESRPHPHTLDKRLGPDHSPDYLLSSVGRLVTLRSLTPGAITGMADRPERAGFTAPTADARSSPTPAPTSYEAFERFAAAMNALTGRCFRDRAAVIADHFTRTIGILREQTRSSTER